MPSATTTQCQVCNLQPARYTCPTCSTRTCSLACTRQHKTIALANGSSTSQDKRGVEDARPASCRPPASSIPPPTSIGTSSNAAAASKVLAPGAAPTAAQTIPQSYVPLSSYTENDFLKDYLFLSSLSRKTSEVGRQLMSQNLLPLPTSTITSANHHPSQNHSQSATGGPNERLTNAQRQKQQLQKQISYRRYKIILLPEGMKLRKLNSSKYFPKEKKVLFTLQLSFPDGSREVSLRRNRSDSTQSEQSPGDEENRETITSAKSPEKGVKSTVSDGGVEFLLHRQDPQSSIHSLILEELQRMSFGNRKDVLRKREELGLSNVSSKPSAKEGSTGKDSQGWILSADLIKGLGLAVPKSARILPIPSTSASVLSSLQADASSSSNKLGSADTEDATAAAGTKVIHLTRFPPSDQWCILIPIVSQRLRNESSLKYLDWWTKKRKWESENPHLAAAAAAEAEAEGKHQHPQSDPLSSLDTDDAYRRGSKRFRTNANEMKLGQGVHHEHGDEAQRPRQQREWGRSTKQESNDPSANDIGNGEKHVEYQQQQQQRNEQDLLPTQLQPPSLPSTSIISSSLLATLSKRLGRGGSSSALDEAVGNSSQNVVDLAGKHQHVEGFSGSQDRGYSSLPPSTPATTYPAGAIQPDGNITASPSGASDTSRDRDQKRGVSDSATSIAKYMRLVYNEKSLTKPSSFSAASLSSSTEADAEAVAVASGSLTLDELLRNRVPEGYGIVEFPVLKVVDWSHHSSDRVLREQMMDLVLEDQEEMGGAGEGKQFGKSAEIPHASDNKGAPATPDSESRSKSGQQERVASTSGGGLGGLLAAYDSDSDSDSVGEGEDEAGASKGEQNEGGDGSTGLEPSSPEQLSGRKGVQNGKDEEAKDKEEEAEADEDDDEDESGSHAYNYSSLTSLASGLGFVGGH